MEPFLEEDYDYIRGLVIVSEEEEEEEEEEDSWRRPNLVEDG